MPTKDSITKKARLAARNAQGLCAFCGTRPKRQNRMSCVECGQKASAYSVRYYYQKRAQNKCARCQAPLTTAESFCDSCKEKNAAKVAERRAVVIAHYGGACGICGETRQECLDVHHKHPVSGPHPYRDPETTNASCHLIRQGFPTDRVLLCKNCHRALHVAVREQQRIGTK